MLRDKKLSQESGDIVSLQRIMMESSEYFYLKKTLLDLTDVCPLLTKQYIQVGLQKNTYYTIFRWSLSTYMVRLRVLVIRLMGSSINLQLI
jgi:hypothetical protein